MTRRSALTVLSLALAAASSAETYSWVTWDLTTKTASSIHGTILTDSGLIGVDVSGNFTDVYTNYPSWNPDASFADGTIVDNAPDTTMLVRVDFAGGFTVSFSQTVRNPAQSMWSVGQGGTAVSYDFDRSIDLVAGGPSAEFNGSALVQSGNMVTGNEGSGTVVLGGSMSSYGFDVIHNEQYHGFTIGLPMVQSVPEPTSMAFLAAGVAVLIRRRRR